MLPGSGLNFTSNFFTPRERNLANYLRKRGAAIVGISPREDRLATKGDNPGVGDWGLARRKYDIHRVISLLDEPLQLPYELLGHSAGGVQALDYAATYGDSVDKVMVLDTTGTYSPVTQPALSRRAKDAVTFCKTMMAGGSDSPQYTIDQGLKTLLKLAVSDPAGTSSCPVRRPDGSPFTNIGAVHYALIKTAELQGPLNWIYVQGFSAGSYTFGATAQDDRFTLAHSPLPIWSEAVGRLGSGLHTIAQLRDLAAVWADDHSTYSIDWAKIGAEVVWVNAELGRGDYPCGANLIRAGGNPKVSFTVVPGYAHADPVWGVNAAQDVWPLLINGRG